MSEKFQRWLAVIAVVIVLSGMVVMWRMVPACATVKAVNMSITVKDIGSRQLVGLNTNTDSLAFGAVSPGMRVIRSVQFQHSVEAEVTVRIEGELSSWARADPDSFSVRAGEKKDIFFILQVPESAVDGDYAGEAGFCVR